MHRLFPRALSAPTACAISARKRAILARLDHLLPRDAEDGQGLAEYALILALIAIVAIVALIYLGSQISDKLSVIGSAI